MKDINTIAQVDRAINITTIDVGEHRFGRWQVPVDVCNNGDTHVVILVSGRTE
jgi:hypothetical protein